MTKFGAIFAALRYGSSLTDPAIWKQRQNLINALIGLLGAVAIFLPVEVSSDDLSAIAGGVAVLGGLLNAYLTTATTDKIGVKPPVRPNDTDQGSNLGNPGP